jgi:AraC-like DNA-binding protein
MNQPVLKAPTLHNYQRYLCPVSGFFNALEDGREEVRHNEKKRKIDFHCDLFEASSYYYFVNDDIILSYQSILPFTSLKTRLQSHKGKRFYVFNLFNDYPGNIALELNQHEFSINGEALIFSNSYCNFQISEKPNTQRSYFQIIVTEKFIREFVDAEILEHNQLAGILNYSEKKLLVMNNYPKILDKDFNEMIYLFSTGQADEFSKIRNFKIVTNFITEFFKTYRIVDPSNAEDVPEETEGKEELLQKYLDENIDQPFAGVDEMAKIFHMSNSTLNRYFIKTFNMTPFEYFRKTQMEYGKKLLIETNLSVSEIAYKLGFNSPANFIRSFKKVVALTPGAYKAQFSTL